MNNKFTPGPWKTWATDEAVILDSTGTSIADCREPGIAPAVAIYNARLMAKSPELLEVVGDFMACISGGVNPNFAAECFEKANNIFSKIEKGE